MIPCSGEVPRVPNDVNDCKSRGGQKGIIPRASQDVDSGDPTSGQEGLCRGIPFGPASHRVWLLLRLDFGSSGGQGRIKNDRANDWSGFWDQAARLATSTADKGICIVRSFSGEFLLRTRIANPPPAGKGSDVVS